MECVIFIVWLPVKQSFSRITVRTEESPAMGRLCRGPCYLRGRRNRAQAALDELELAKENLEREKRGEKPQIPCCTRLKRAIGGCFRAVFPCCYPKPPDGTLKLPPNYWDRSVCSEGILGRTIRTFLVFIVGQLIGLLFWLVISLKWGEDPEFVGILVGGGAQAVTIGMMAFPSVRCVGLLCLPELLTKRGRAILMLMATVWVLQGPAANINTNQVLVVRTLGCVSGTMKNQTLELKEMIKNALSERLAPFKEVLQKVRSLLKRLEGALGKITMVLNRMLSAIQRAFDWLQAEVDACKNAALSPYFKCMNVMPELEHLCYTGPVRIWFFIIGKSCSASSFMDICECAKSLQMFCRFPERVKNFLEEQVLNKIKAGLEKAADAVSKAFKFQVNMGRRGTYQVKVESNITLLYDMVEEMARKFKQVIHILAEILNWLVVALLFLTLIKAILYRRSYVKNDYKDNLFLTHSLKELDRDRDLANKEKRLYVSPLSPRLTKSERHSIFAGFTHTFLSSLFALIYMALDYMTYEFIHTIFVYFGEDTAVDVPNFYDVSVRGNGYVADAYDKMMRALVPALNQTTATHSWRRCIQTPSHPDYELYKRVGQFLGACYGMVVVQVYLLRFRQFICGQFYPQRKKIRALHLYNIILKSRGGFIGLMKRGFLGDGFGEALAARQPVLGHILRVVGAEKVHCSLCLLAGEKTDTDNFRMCNSRECTAAYCIECYGQLRVCRMCQLKLLTEDDMMYEEAKDSSDEDEMDTTEQKTETPILVEHV